MSIVTVKSLKFKCQTKFLLPNSFDFPDKKNSLIILHHNFYLQIIGKSDVIDFIEAFIDLKRTYGLNAKYSLHYSCIIIENDTIPTSDRKINNSKHQILNILFHSELQQPVN